jgi:hypothetical protein
VTLGEVAIAVLLDLVLAFWVLSLVRRGRLYVAYAVLFLVLSAIAGVVLAVLAVPSASGRRYGDLRAMFLLGGAIVAFLLVYVLNQLTIVSNRIATLIQELALDGAGPSAPPPRLDQTGTADRQERETGVPHRRG